MTPYCLVVPRRWSLGLLIRYLSKMPADAALETGEFQQERPFGLSRRPFTSRGMANTEVIRWTFACALVGGFSFSCASQPFTPALGNVPSMTTETYGYWAVRCSQPSRPRIREAWPTVYFQSC